MLTKVTRTCLNNSRNFASLTAGAESNYSQFRAAYVDNLSKFKSTMKNVEETNTQVNNSNRKAFKHEFNGEDQSINLNPARLDRLFYEFLGPEQVSPHYESFLASRKWAIGAVTGTLTLSYLGTSMDFHWIARSCLIPFVFNMTLWYWIFEGRKFLLKPLYQRWYREMAEHDIRNVMSYWNDSMRLKIRGNLNEAKSQMDFYLLHKGFNEVKAESINRFLAHEQMNLKKHINDRSLNLLKAAKAAETGNSRTVVNKIVTNTLNSLDARLESESDRIQESIFEAALSGIKTGKMTYANDAVLAIASESLKAETAKIKDLSAEEKLKLIALTDMQINTLKNGDEAAKSEYVETLPKFDQMTTSTDAYQKVAETWGK